MSKRQHLPLAALLVTVCLVYLNFFGNGFHFDDFHTVTDNPAVRSLDNLPRIFTDTTAFSVLPANQTYRPVVTASLALDYAMGRGYNLFWFHLSTLLWFLVLIAVLFRFAQVVFNHAEAAPSNQWLALGVTAWFGLHPAMAETVNYVIQRGDLYCTLGCLSALLLFALYPGRRRYGLYLIPFALAMLSKPPAAVFPLLVLLYIFLFEAEGRSLGRWRVGISAALPATAVTIVLLWLQSVMTPKSYAPTILSASAYRLVQPLVWMRYVGALFLPLHLNVDTDLQPMSSLNGVGIEGLVFVAGMIAVLLFATRHRRLYPIAYGLLWFVLTQLPTSLYTLSEVENDHRMFFSFPGLMIAVVWALHLGYERLVAERAAAGKMPWWLPRLTATLCGFVLCGYGYGVHRRNAVWHDEASLWADDAAKSPHNGRGLMIYGLTKMNAGDFAGALEMFNRALMYAPNYATLEINLGIVNGLLADTGKPELNAVAETHFQRALALTPNDDLTHAYYGRWLLAHGRLPEATSQLEEAVASNGQRAFQRDLLLSAYTKAGNTSAARELAQSTLAVIPGDGAALAVVNGTAPGRAPTPAADRINASLAAYRAGKYPESVAEAEAALRVDPHSAEAWNNIGAGYGAMGQWDRGIAAEEKALELDPNLAIAANNLHWFQAQRVAGGHSGGKQPAGESARTAADFVNLSLTLNQGKHYVESVKAARQALVLDPGSAEAWNNIAADYEVLGRWDDAIDAATKAVALRPDFQLAKNNLQWSLQQKALATSDKTEPK